MRFSQLLLATIAASSLLACNSSAPQSSPANLTEGVSVVAVDASSRVEETFLEEIWSVRLDTALECPPTGPCKGSETQIRVLETAGLGGDPAANGTGVLLNLEHRGESRTFDTGLDVISVDGIDTQVLEGTNVERVFISVTESTYDEATGLLGYAENEYFVEFSADNLSEAKVYDTSLLPSSEAEALLSPSDDAKYGLVPLLWSVTTAEAEGLQVRVYELAGGDPAYNGTSVFVSAFDYDTRSSRTWDTGLNVLEVKTVRMVSTTELEIITEKDFPQPDGDVATGPVVYPAKIDRSEEGLGDKLLIDRTPPVG